MRSSGLTEEGKDESVLGGRGSAGHSFDKYQFNGLQAGCLFGSELMSQLRPKSR